jgi:uncharacterized protein
MATYERSGVVLDQCRECRGIYLDRGELEHLVDAEGGAWLGPAPRPGTSPAGAGVAFPPAPARDRDASIEALWDQDADWDRGPRLAAHANRGDSRGYRSEWHHDDDPDALHRPSFQPGHEPHLR